MPSRPDRDVPAAGTDADADADDSPLILGMLDSFGQFVDGAQRSASERFDTFMLDLDDFFAGDTETDRSNESYVRLRVDAEKPAVGPFELDPSVKVRVVLPRSEQRVRFLFSSEDDPGDAGENIGDGVRVADAANRQSASFALRFVRGLRDGVDTSIDLGVRQRRGRIQVFTRLRALVERPLGERWTFRATDRYYYYYVTGHENQLRFDFTRPTDSDYDRFVRATTTFDWRRGRNGASIGQTLGAYADLSERTSLAAELLARYDTAPDDGSARYRGAEARLRLRRNVWRPWFFYELWPSISWPAETDYRRVWNALARIEVTIGGVYRAFPEESLPASPPPDPDDVAPATAPDDSPDAASTDRGSDP